jgi:hypothetical protein
MKIKFISFILLVFVIQQSCTTKKNLTPFAQILNSNFLTITDTFAYHFHSFVLIPNKPIETYNLKTELLVGIFQNFQNSDEFQQDIIENLQQKGKTNYIELLKSKNQKPLVTFDMNDVKNTGKYILKKATNYDKLDSNYVGYLSFFEPVIGDNIAILFVTIQKSLKAGRINAYLVEKIANTWKIIETIEIGRI